MPRGVTNGDTVHFCVCVFVCVCVCVLSDPLFHSMLLFNTDMCTKTHTRRELNVPGTVNLQSLSWDRDDRVCVFFHLLVCILLCLTYRDDVSLFFFSFMKH